MKSSQIIIILTLLLSRGYIMGQDELKELNQIYKKVEVSSIKIKQDEMLNKIHSIIDGMNNFTEEKVGKSFEGRDIYLIKFGIGGRKVLLWSQMHGDEPTATLAILDILEYLAKNFEDKSVKNIYNNLEVLFLPMLNPDGSEHFKRRNSQDIDVNRDAARLQTPEGRILKNIIDRYKPEFGFNLHDQDPYFAAGKSDSLVTIALLAPAIDDKNTTNKTRKKAKQIVVHISNLLSKIIPGHIARYDDEFEKRAFGDNIQLWGTSTILIESGGYHSDPGKEEIRKLNFISIISSLRSISSEAYAKIDLNGYENIPENKRNFFDLLIRNCNLSQKDFHWVADIGINFDKDIRKIPASNINGKISDMGDLSTMNGITEIDASRYEIQAGSFIMLENQQLKETLKSTDSIKQLLEKGITTIISERDANLVGIRSTSINLIFLSSERYDKLRIMLNMDKPIIENSEFLTKIREECFDNPFVARGSIKLNKYADLVFRQDDKVKIALINGIKIYEDGKLLQGTPGIIFIDR